MLLKTAGAVLVLFSTAALGFYFGKTLKMRLEDLRDLKKCFVILKGDIRYAKTPLPEALGSLACRSRGGFKPFFSGLCQRLMRMEGESFQTIWEQEVTAALKETSLNEGDKACLLHMGQNLGFPDREMQLNALDLYIEQIETRIVDLEGSIKEKVRLYHILGIMAGVFITVVMI